MATVRGAMNRLMRAARSGSRELRGTGISSPGPVTASVSAGAPAFPHSVAVSDGRVLCDHPLAPHIILDGHCLLVTPRVLMGSYEPAVTAFLMRAVQPGDTVVDIGANQGFHTLTLGLRVGPTGHVWAFEPHPRTRAFLQDNVDSNGLHHTVTVVDAAAWSSAGELTFRARTGEAAGSYLVDAFAIPDDRVTGEDVTVRTVDTGAYLAALPAPPTLIKLDAEGAETTILRSAELVLRDHHPTTILEILPSSFETVAALDEWEAWLLELGYEIGRLDHDGSVQPLGSDGLRSVSHSGDVVLWVPGGRGAPR
jgi:FkbM family methyltransferase